MPFRSPQVWGYPARPGFGSLSLFTTFMAPAPGPVHFNPLSPGGPAPVKVLEPTSGSSKKPMRPYRGAMFVGTPLPGQVKQDGLNSCPLMATLAAMANSRPALLTAMVDEPEPARVFSDFDPQKVATSPAQLRFFLFFSDRLIRVRFPTGGEIRMSNLLFTNTQDPNASQLSWTTFSRASNGAGWVSFIEKAYALFRGGGDYGGIDFAQTADEVMFDLVGNGTHFQLVETDVTLPDPTNPSQVVHHTIPEFTVLRMRNGLMDLPGRTLAQPAFRRELRTAFGRVANRPTVITTSNHTLAVTEFRQGANPAEDELTIYDPLSGGLSGLEDVLLDDLFGQTRFETVVQAN